MAEVAGLVIGGISLAAIFDQCISIIKCIDSGISCSNEYQDAALMLTLLGGRLNRWERTIRESAAGLSTTEDDGENAELWLKQIRRRLEEAAKLGERYTAAAAAATAMTPIATKRSTEVARMIEKVQGKILHRGDRLSLRKRARWALFDQEKMNSLLDRVDKLVGSLEQIAPSLEPQRVEMAKNDVVELLDANDTSEPQALEVLKVAAAKVDKDFNLAATVSSHTYRYIDIMDKAKVNMGDLYAPEWARGGGIVVQGRNNIYEGIRIRGESIVNVGTMYGKSVFET